MSAPVRRLGLTTVLASAVLLTTTSDGLALTIVRNFTGGAAPGNAAGGGNLVSIFGAAADCWEAAILDIHTVTLNFSWGPLGGSTIGLHSLNVQGGVPNRETVGTITFDNDGSAVWFMDPTPTDNVEYGTFTEFTANLGGGPLNVGRVFTSPSGDAVGRLDLFSVVLHEIGHSLGLSAANTSFIAENGDLDIDVQAPRPFAGTVIPTDPGGTAHLNLANALMQPGISPGIRRLPSAVDILANAEVSQFNNLDLEPKQLPEPSTVALLFIGAPLAVWLFERRGGRRQQR